MIPGAKSHATKVLLKMPLVVGGGRGRCLASTLSMTKSGGIKKRPGNNGFEIP